MRALLLVIAACSYERSELPPPPPPKPAPVVLRPPPIVVVGADAERHLHPGGAPRAFASVQPASDGIRAAHASMITTLAVTDDGGAAVTTDFTGATRLWPALDGTLAPVVVDADHPAQLAIARDGDGFVIASLDRAGQLTFLTVGSSGAIGWQTRVESARPFTRVVAAKEDFAAITDDGKLATFGAGGIPRETFAPPPGEHLVSLAVRGKRHLALVSTAAGVRGRWFLDSGFIGEPTAVLPIEAEHAALSPEGKLAAVRKGHMGVAVVELEHGKPRVVWRAESVADNAFPIGFTAERDLWYMLEGEVALERAGKSELQKLVVRDNETTSFAVGDRGFAWGHGGGLVVSDGGKPRKLAYRLGTLAEIMPLDHGFIVGDGQKLALLDDRFAEREELALPVGTTTVAAIDRHRALANVDDGVYALDLDDARRNEKVIALAKSAVVYQPATHLFAATVTGGVQIGRYDPATDTFTDTTKLSYDSPIYRIWLPASGGLRMEAQGDGGARIITYAVDKELHATESSSHVVRGDENTFDAALPKVARHGALVASLADERLHLRDGDTERWVVPARGITGLYFTPRGALIAVGGGIAEVALTTGALVGPRCGWLFGAWDDIESNFEATSAMLCDPRE